MKRKKMLLNMLASLTEKNRHFAFIMLLSAFFCLLIIGCGFQFRTGTLPNINRLKDLTLSVSTKEDVRKIAGRPDRFGRYMFPEDNTPKDLWCYYYEESSLSESQRLFLFVFFDHDFYTGYMWVSSLPQFAILGDDAGN